MNSKKFLAGLYLVMGGAFVVRAITYQQNPVTPFETALGLILVTLGMMKCAIEEMKASKQLDEIELMREEIQEREYKLKTREIFVEEIMGKVDKEKNKVIEKKIN